MQKNIPPQGGNGIMAGLLFFQTGIVKGTCQQYILCTAKSSDLASVPDSRSGRSGHHSDVQIQPSLFISERPGQRVESSGHSMVLPSTRGRRANSHPPCQTDPAFLLFPPLPLRRNHHGAAQNGPSPCREISPVTFGCSGIFFSAVNYIN